MKKIITIGATILAGLSLAACGNNSTSSSNKATTSSQQLHGKYYFDGTTANLQDVKIKIIDVKFYQGNDSTDGKNLIAFEYEITNKTDKDIDAINGWQTVFNAYQDNKNTEGKLEVGPLPANTSDEILHDQDQTIKKGGTVKCIAAYELDSNSKPVVLKATKGYDGTVLGKKTFKIGKFLNQDETNSSENDTQQSSTQKSTVQSKSDTQQSSAQKSTTQTKPGTPQTSNTEAQDQRPSDVPANYKEYTSYTTDGHKMTQWNDAGSYCGDPDVQYETQRLQTEAGF